MSRSISKKKNTLKYEDAPSEDLKIGNVRYSPEKPTFKKNYTPEQIICMFENLFPTENPHANPENRQK